MEGLVLGLAVVLMVGTAAETEKPTNRTIDDYKIDVLGVRLPANWFFRNVGVGQPAEPKVMETGTNRGLNSGVGFGYADPGHG